MLSSIKEWLAELLFDWVYVLLYRLLQGFLYLLSFVEKFFDIFAGTAKVYYKGDTTFLLDIFFAHNSVTNAFWAMALIAIALSFGFAIFNLARKVTDVSGRMKQTVGDIMGNFVRCLLIILVINAGTVAVINMTNVLLDRINYALKNAEVLDQEPGDKTFSEQEYATMARILATIGNYSVNPAADNRYNINSCYNALRPDLLSLYYNGFFDYDYPMDKNGHYSWQGALQLIAVSSDLTQDLPLDVYNNEVAGAIQTVAKELTTYRDFAPQKTAKREEAGTMSTDVVIFLLCGMKAAENKQYRTGRFDDALRKDYINGVKDYNDLSQVRKDFDLWKMDYLLGYISSIVMVILLSICIFTFIVRMFNLMLLFITAPLFASSMPLDDGGKWQSWTQAFVIQLFSGFGLVIAMRLYLLVIPVVLSSDLTFFAGSDFGTMLLNDMAELMMILGGAWAVLQSGNVITGILAGNPGMAAIQQEGMIAGRVTNFAFGTPRMALNSARSLANGALFVPRRIANRISANKAKKANNAKGGQGGEGGGEGGSGGKLPARVGRGQGASDARTRKGGSGGSDSEGGGAPVRASRTQDMSDAKAQGGGSGGAMVSQAPPRRSSSMRIKAHRQGARWPTTAVKKSYNRSIPGVSGGGGSRAAATSGRTRTQGASDASSGGGSKAAPAADFAVTTASGAVSAAVKGASLVAEAVSTAASGVASAAGDGIAAATSAAGAASQSGGGNATPPAPRVRSAGISADASASTPSAGTSSASSSPAKASAKSSSAGAGKPKAPPKRGNRAKK